MERRRIRDEADARACVAAAKKAGLSLASWGRGAGVDGRSLHAWSMNLARGELGQRRRTQRIKGVQLVELVTAVAPARREAARYTVRVGKLSVEVSDDFEPAALRRLLAVLAPLCQGKMSREPGASSPCSAG
jgi:hypothetical protein